MIRKSFLPKSFLNNGQAIAISRYAIYCPGVFAASAVCAILDKRDRARGLPLSGTCVCNGKTYYWVRYGFLNDPALYIKKG